MTKRLIEANITVDKELKIINADSEFYDFCGDNSFDSMLACVHENDIDKLKNCFEELEHAAVFMEVVRVKDHFRRFVPMLTTVKKANSEEGQAYELNLVEIRSMKQSYTEFKTEVDELNTYMGLTQSVLASYDVAADVLKAFMLGDSGQPVPIYEGPLDVWHDYMLRNSNVDGDYLEEYEDLCNCLSNGEKFFLKTVRMKLFAEDEHMRKCILTGKLATINGQTKIYAVITLGKDVGNLKEDLDVTTKMKDEETGLLNEKAIKDYARTLIDSEPDYPVTLALIDIDNFHEIKEKFGEEFAKDVILKTAEITNNAVGIDGVSGRVGEDTFMIVVENCYSDEDVRSYVRTIRNNINWMYNEGEAENSITCSIGSASYPNDAGSYSEVFNITDKMLELAKKKGKNRYLVYIDEIHSHYIKDGEIIDTTDKRFFKFRKVRIMNNFVRDYMRNTDPEARAKHIESIGLSFAVDCILIYDRRNHSKTVLYGEDKTSESIDFLEIDNFIPSFREDGLLVIDNINFYENKAPLLYQTYSEAGVSQAIQYVVGGNIAQNNEVVVTFYRYDQLNKWTEYDINYIAILGDIIGSVYKGI